MNGHPRHSQSQGCVERGNRTIQGKIGKLASLGGYSTVTQMIDEIAEGEMPEKNSSGYPWSSWLPRVMFALNSQMSKTTKKSPFEAVFGQMPLGNIFPGARVGVLQEEEVTDCLVEDDGESVEKNDPPAECDNHAEPPLPEDVDSPAECADHAEPPLPEDVDSPAECADHAEPPLPEDVDSPAECADQAEPPQPEGVDSPTECADLG